MSELTQHDQAVEEARTKFQDCDVVVDKLPTLVKVLELKDFRIFLANSLPTGQKVLDDYLQYKETEGNETWHTFEDYARRVVANAK